MSSIVETSKLNKSYGKSRGIIDVTFTMNEGEVFGFLGPNGAGKTTTLRILMGLLKADAGTSTIGGLDCWRQSVEVKRLIGYLPSELSLDPGLTGAQLLTYLGNLRGGVDQKYVKQLIDRLGLDPSKKFREYSHGNKQKVGLVQAFMHKPRLLLLDEPTGGLDPLNQQEFYTMVAEVKAEGRTILLSSHILPEVEHTCDRVAIIREGTLVRVDHVSNLRDLRHREVEITFAGAAKKEWFTAIAGVRDVKVGDGGGILSATVQADGMPAVIATAAEHGATNIISREPSLEDIFLRFYENEPTKKTKTDSTPAGARK